MNFHTSCSLSESYCLTRRIHSRLQSEKEKKAKKVDYDFCIDVCDDSKTYGLSNRCAASHDIEERTMHVLFGLGYAVTELYMQLGCRYLLAAATAVHVCKLLASIASNTAHLISCRWELRIICTSCAFIACRIMSCILKRVCWRWGNLTFSSWWVSSFHLIHWVWAQTLDLSGRSTIEPLTSLQDLIYLHLVRNFNILQIR